MMKIQITDACVVCHYDDTISVSVDELAAYESGTHVQDAFPSLSNAQREFFFLSGICGYCWEKMFGIEE